MVLIAYLNSSMSPFVNVLKLLCLLTAVLDSSSIVPNTCEQRHDVTLIIINNKRIIK